MLTYIDHVKSIFTWSIMLKAELDFLIDVYRYFGGTGRHRVFWCVCFLPVLVASCRPQ